ncbi:MAG: DUF3307 domain-containing protein [Mucilaginibacter polytrichastri]|nr:DUF3307 domain-containing protein [Mucilaginibacter polytrichastri]
MLLALKLLLAHLVADFLLQPAAWIKNRDERHFRAPSMYMHAGLHAVFAWFFSGYWAQIWILPLMGITHLLIDGWKSYRPAKLRWFLADQLLHLLVIVLIWCLLTQGFEQVWQGIYQVIRNENVLLVVCAYMIALWPMGYAIGMATKRWRDEVTGDGQSLEKAGMWIGLLERFLILTFILIGRYESVGLLIAAKSIIRFTDKENTQKKTEYILIGTLISFAGALCLGLATAALQKL